MSLESFLTLSPHTHIQSISNSSSSAFKVNKMFHFSNKSHLFHQMASPTSYESRQDVLQSVFIPFSTCFLLSIISKMSSLPSLLSFLCSIPLPAHWYPLFRSPGLASSWQARALALQSGHVQNHSDFQWRPTVCRRNPKGFHSLAWMSDVVNISPSKWIPLCSEYVTLQGDLAFHTARDLASFSSYNLLSTLPHRGSSWKARPPT